MRKPLRAATLASVGLVAIAGAAYAFLHWRSDVPSPSGARGAMSSAMALLELSEGDFRPPPEDWRLDLPRDHGAHAGARAETWVISAHLNDRPGERHALQLAFFRIALVGPTAPQADSAWVPRELYAGQLMLLRSGEDSSTVERRLNRGVLGLAGHEAARGKIRLDNWSIGYGNGSRAEQVTLDATVGDVRAELVLTPTKAAFAPGGDATAAPFHGYSITRMSVAGVFGPEGHPVPVTGLAWLDHLWGDVPLPGGPIVWDRLQLQLDDGTDLAVLRSRRRDGGGTPTLAGFVVEATGAVEPIDAGSLEMEPTRSWRRSRRDAAYPVEWDLSGPDLELQVSALVDDQLQQFGEPVWSGIVAAAGEFRGRPVSGVGTLQLTGYGAP